MGRSDIFRRFTFISPLAIPFEMITLRLSSERCADGKKMPSFYCRILTAYSYLLLSLTAVSKFFFYC